MSVLRAFNLLTAAMMAGGLTMVMLAVVPTFHRLPDGLAISLHRKVDRYVDVPLPIFTGLTCVSALVLLFDSAQPTGARVLVAVAAGCTIVVALSSHFVNRPMNLRVGRWPAGPVPPEYRRLRRAWDRAHAFRTIVGLASLVCLIVAMLVSWRGR